MSSNFYTMVFKSDQNCALHAGSKMYSLMNKVASLTDELVFIADEATLSSKERVNVLKPYILDLENTIMDAYSLKTESPNGFSEGLIETASRELRTYRSLINSE